MQLLLSIMLYREHNVGYSTYKSPYTATLGIINVVLCYNMVHKVQVPTYYRGWRGSQVFERKHELHVLATKHLYENDNFLLINYENLKKIFSLSFMRKLRSFLEEKDELNCSLRSRKFSKSRQENGFQSFQRSLGQPFEYGYKPSLPLYLHFHNISGGIILQNVCT